MRLLLTLCMTAGLCLAAPQQLGQPLTLKTPTAITALTSQPADYIGKIVLARGSVGEVCQAGGCWMTLVEPQTKATIRIKVKEGEIVFPKNAVGKTATVQGKFVKIELTKEQAIAQAKHEAEENGKPFDPATVTGARIIYQIRATGAVID